MNKPKITPQNLSSSVDGKSGREKINFTDKESFAEEIENSTERSQEAEYSAWESQIAELVGLEEESLNSNAGDVNEKPASKEEEEFTTTKQTLSSNPFAKLGLVSSATLIIALLVGVFLSQITNIGHTKSSDNEPVASEPEEQSTTESYMLELEEEVETLKTKLALSKQAEAVKIAQQTLKKEIQEPKETPQSEANITTNSTPPRQTEPLPTVASTASEPKVVYIERPAPPTTPLSPPKTKPDPFQEWTRLAKLGSYGQVSVDSESQQIARQTQNRIPEPEPQIARQTQNRIPERQITQQEQIPSEDSLATRLALKQNRKSVAVGSRAKGILATAVFGETTKSSNPDKQEETVFVVNLQKPLKASNGEIALPVDTQLLVKIGSLSERGMVRLKVDKVIVPEDDENNPDISLPPNAIAIHSPGGKPLLAKKFPDRSGSITMKDAQLFLLGGLGKAAEIYNRTDTEVIINDGSSTTVSSDSSDRNFSAGAVQGGIETLVPILAQRNQQEISQLMQRTDVWLVPAGTKVELYVNREIQL